MSLDDSPLPENTFAEADSVQPSRLPVWGWPDVALFFGLGLPLIVLAQIAFALLAKSLHYSDKDPVLGIFAQAIAYVLLFLLLAAILRVQYRAQFWTSLGWLPSRIPDIASVFLGIALAFGLAIVGGLLKIQNPDSAIQKLLDAPHSALILAVFGTLVAPLAEELAFRGFLQPLLVRSMGAFLGISVTALLFGMLHWEQNARSWAFAGMISLAGAGFGVLRHLSGSTRPSIVAHIAYNSTLFLAYFANERKFQF